MELWDRFRTLLKVMCRSGPRHYELTGRLQTVLVARTAREPRPAQELQDQLLAAGSASRSHAGAVPGIPKDQTLKVFSAILHLVWQGSFANQHAA